MSRGPLNRLVGALGLAALVPTALMSATGHLTTTDTAIRAGVTLALVMVLRRLAGWYLNVTAAAFERQADAEPEAHGETQAEASDADAATRGRRREDAADVQAESAA